MSESHKHTAVSIEKPVFSCTDTDDPSVYIDMETETELARVTLWASQRCDMEAIAKATGATVLYKRVCMDENNYQEKCSAFLEEVEKISH